MSTDSIAFKTANLALSNSSIARVADENAFQGVLRQSRTPSPITRPAFADTTNEVRRSTIAAALRYSTSPSNTKAEATAYEALFASVLTGRLHALQLESAKTEGQDGDALRQEGERLRGAMKQYETLITSHNNTPPVDGTEFD